MGSEMCIRDSHKQYRFDAIGITNRAVIVKTAYVELFYGVHANIRSHFDIFSKPPLSKRPFYRSLPGRTPFRHRIIRYPESSRKR